MLAPPVRVGIGQDQARLQHLIAKAKLGDGLCQTGSEQTLAYIRSMGVSELCWGTKSGKAKDPQVCEIFH